MKIFIITFFKRILIALESPHLWTDVVMVGTAVAPHVAEPWKGLVLGILGVVSFYFHSKE